MAVDFETFRRELRAFDGRREVLRALRADLRTPLPAARAVLRSWAVGNLPSSGGLGVWVGFNTKVTAVVSTGGRSALIRIKGSRKVGKDKADLVKLDAGAVRHPSWGRTGAGQWHTQAVAPGFFSDTVGDREQWRAVAESAADRAFDLIRRG